LIQKGKILKAQFLLRTQFTLLLVFFSARSNISLRDTNTLFVVYFYCVCFTFSLLLRLGCVFYLQMVGKFDMIKNIDEKKETLKLVVK